MADNLYKQKGSPYWSGRIRIEGKQFRKSFKTTSRSEANRRVVKWIAGLQDNINNKDPERYTFDELGKSYYRNVLPTFTEDTQDGYFKSLDKFLEPFFGNMYLDEITAAELYKFSSQRRLSKYKRKGWKKAKPVQTPTIIRDLTALSSMFTHAQDDLDWDIANPVQPFLRKQKRKGTLKDSDSRTRYLSHEEEDRLLAAVIGNNRNPHLSAQMITAIETGMRLGEQFKLTWEVQDKNRPFEVDLKKQMITVTGKRNKIRQIPILPRALEILKKLPRHVSSPYVFYNCGTDRNIDGAPIKNPKGGLEGASTRSGVTDLIWHDLRRTCGCRLLQDRKMSMAEVSLWLGHSSVTTTEKNYAFLDIEKIQEKLSNSSI